MGWLSKIVKQVAPYAPVIVAIVAPEIIPIIGEALGASAGAGASAAGSAAIAGGTTLATGGTPEQAAKSAAGAGVASGITSELTSSGTSKPVATGIGQTGGALVTGAKPEEAVKRGVISGGVEAAFGSPEKDATTADRALSAVEKGVATKTLSDLFAPTTQYRSAQTVGGGATPVPTSVTTTGAGQAPGSQALAQALRIGDPGAPIFGGDKEDKGKQSGWNVESLRYMGQEEK
jgi:hypothetical protein